MNEAGRFDNIHGDEDIYMEWELLPEQEDCDEDEWLWREENEDKLFSY
jgi:hypothetical protein